MRPYRYWGERDEKDLVLLYPNHTTTEIARHFGRSISSVRSKASDMGCAPRRTYREWTDEDIEFITREVGQKPMLWMALNLGRSYYDVRNKLIKLGLRPKFMKRTRR